MLFPVFPAQSQQVIESKAEKSGETKNQYISGISVANTAQPSGINDIIIL